MTDPVLGMLLAAVVADPGDDGCRLAYADRCLELGNDDRADFIHVQVGLAGMPAPSPRCAFPYWCPCDACGRHWLPRRLRQRDLLTRNPAWTPYPLAAFADVTFRRGFVSEVRLPCNAWLLHGPAICRAAPLTYVRLADKQPYFTFTHLWGWSRLEQDRDAGAPAYLPPDLYDRLPEPDEIAPPVGLWRTENRAEDALSSAALSWARSVTPEAATP